MAFACSYFLMKESGDVLEEQKGIVRTNCMDCLDRTNVTQVQYKSKYFTCIERKIMIPRLRMLLSVR